MLNLYRSPQFELPSFSEGAELHEVLMPDLPAEARGTGVFRAKTAGGWTVPKTSFPARLADDGAARVPTPWAGIPTRNPRRAPQRPAKNR